MTEIEKAAGNTRSYDFIFVNSAGNDEMDAQHSWWSQYVTDPAFTERLLTVGSVGQNEQGELVYSSLSNWGTAVNIAAPGENILSTVPADYQLYQTLSGTSMAAPHVAGVAAMIWSLAPNLTGPEVKQIILENSTVTIRDQRNYSYPMLNAYASAKEAFMQADGMGVLDINVFNSSSKQFLYGADLRIVPLEICQETDSLEENNIVVYPLVKQLKLGQYEVTVSKDGYHSHTETITVTRDSTINLNVSLKPTEAPEITKGTLNGAVTFNSTSLSGIKVNVLNGTSLVATLITDEAGQYSIDLDPGQYTLSIDAEGYVPVSTNTTVFVGKTTTENIELDNSMYATVSYEEVNYQSWYTITLHNATAGTKHFKVTLRNGTALYDTANGIRSNVVETGTGFRFPLDDELCQGSVLNVDAYSGQTHIYDGEIVMSFGALWNESSKKLPDTNSVGGYWDNNGFYHSSDY